MSNLTDIVKDTRTDLEQIKEVIIHDGWTLNVGFNVNPANNYFIDIKKQSNLIDLNLGIGKNIFGTISSDTELLNIGSFAAPDKPIRFMGLFLRDTGAFENHPLILTADGSLRTPIGIPITVSVQAFFVNLTYIKSTVV
jgi:hypothetical protein